MTSYTQICRACLSFNVSFNYILAENVSTEIYCFCTSIEVQQDNLPMTLCDACYDLLIKCSEFKRTCLESHNALLHLSCNARKIPVDEKLFDQLAHHRGPDELNVKTEHFVNFNDEDTAVKAENTSDHYDDLFEAVNLCESSIINEKKIKKRKLSKVRKQKRPKIKLKIPRKHFAFACDICNKKFNYQERLDAHKLEHDGKVAIIHCPECNKTFMTWSGLKRHNESEHTQVSLDKLKCNVCGKVCKSQQTLKTHGKTHGDRKLFVCDICGKGFTSKFILKV
ncbi:zinc finger and BTB domain-containing protein 41-like isoform X2 [Ostrinia furnacalis]|uniref:zinc finger and BTB domain-containing protein 41-like isoform X2 n=1 Tax=Ostrinia furnacalis TaxID=93504 RepID=UPI00104033D5|nr:zinc finger and BTB domain-containing protein 41-like isoform X2 [Ostrinia furnacalis]